MEGPDRVLIEIEQALFNSEISDVDFKEMLDKKWGKYDEEDDPTRMDPRFFEILKLIKEYRKEIYEDMKEGGSAMWLGYINEIEK